MRLNRNRIKNRTQLKPSSFKTSSDIGMDEFSMLQFVTALPVPALPHCSSLVYLSRDEARHLGNLRDKVWFGLKAKHLQRDVMPLLSFYEVDEGEVPVRISRRLDENVVAVLLMRVDHILQERPYERDARTIDGLQYTAIITIVGGRMDDLAEGLHGMFSARVDPREM